MKTSSINSTSGQDREFASGNINRNEIVQSDERPFAEMRKNINDLMRIAALHRWVFFIPFCLVTCTSFVASLYYPRTYQAKTSFERRNDPIMMNLPMSAGAASFKYFRNTMVRDLTSVDTVTEALKEMDMPAGLKLNEDGSLTKVSQRKRNSMARSLASTLRATTSSPSELIDIINITYTGPDPTIGKKLVNQLKITYVRRTMAWIHDYLVSQRDYFQREADESMARFKKAQRVKTRVQLENPMMNPIDPSALSMRLSQLELEKRELGLRKREYESELSAQRQLLAAIAPDGEASPDTLNYEEPEPEWFNPEVIRLRNQIAEIAKRVDQLRTIRGMTDMHPEVHQLLQSRRNIENRLSELGVKSVAIVSSNQSIAIVASSTPDSGARSMRQWQSDRSRMKVQIASQESKIKDIHVSLKINEQALETLQQAKSDIYNNQEEFAEITGNVTKARQEYNQFESTLSQIEPAIKAIEQNRLLQFSKGQPARGGSTPVSPKALTVIFLALLAGAAAGTVFVILAELFDHVYRSSNQVICSLGLPILETVDEIVTSHDRRRLLVQRAFVTPLVLICCFGLTGLTGTMAYLSIKQPWTYQKIKNIPQAALDLFVDRVINDKDDNRG